MIYVYPYTLRGWWVIAQQPPRMGTSDAPEDVRARALKYLDAHPLPYGCSFMIVSHNTLMEGQA